MERQRQRERDRERDRQTERGRDREREKRENADHLCRVLKSLKSLILRKSMAFYIIDNLKRGHENAMQSTEENKNKE